MIPPANAGGIMLSREIRTRIESLRRRLSSTSANTGRSLYLRPAADANESLSLYFADRIMLMREIRMNIASLRQRLASASADTGRYHIVKLTETVEQSFILCYNDPKAVNQYV